MDKIEAGELVDRQVEEWKRDLEAMRVTAGERDGDAGASLRDQVEGLRRELQGLRIVKVATWHAPEDQWESARAHFEEKWSEWTARAQALQRSLAE
jgi:hypothetical protein